MAVLVDKPGSNRDIGPKSNQPAKEGQSTWRAWLRHGWKLMALLLLAAAAVYWVKLSPLPVREHRLERGQIVAEVMGTGTLEARVKVTISPKISGRIKEVYADQGDRAGGRRAGIPQRRQDSVVVSDSPQSAAWKMQSRLRGL